MVITFWAICARSTALRIVARMRHCVIFQMVLLRVIRESVLYPNAMITIIFYGNICEINRIINCGDHEKTCGIANVQAMCTRKGTRARLTIQTARGEQPDTDMQASDGLMYGCKVTN